MRKRSAAVIFLPLFSKRLVASRSSAQLTQSDGHGLWIGHVSGDRDRKGQADFNHQAALRPIGCLDFSAVQAHGAISDGQAQADAASLAAAGIVDAIERAEQFVECVLGNSGAAVGHTDYCFRGTRGVALLETHLDARALMRVTDGIAYDIF